MEIPLSLGIILALIVTAGDAAFCRWRHCKFLTLE